MDFSYIICYRHNDERYNNLLKVIKYLRSNFNFELILVEQDKSERVPDKTIFDQYIFSYSDRPFNRSWAFNVGAKYSTTNKIFFGDCDLICPVPQMNETLEKLDEFGCVSPYKKVVDLHPQESVSVDLNSWGNINRGGRGGINLTGGIVGFQKNEFYKISGWCEEFEGWGGEDDFQTWKVKQWVSNYEVEGDVYHLHHARPQLDPNVYQKNIAILRSIGSQDPQKVVNWINSSRSTIGNENKHIKVTSLDKEYGDYLKGKRVVIVGPAPSIIGYSQKDLIESYDVVVRLNKAVPVPQERIEDVGSRTDIYYHCMSQLPQNCGEIKYDLLKDKIKFISSPYPNIFPFDKDIKQFHSQNNNRLKLHLINENLFNSFSREMNTRPNSGICAILDLLSFDIKELYVTGFTFFKGGYDKTYRDQTEEQVMGLINQYKVHNVDSQKEYMKNLFKNEPRLKGDEKLMEIINE